MEPSTDFSHLQSTISTALISTTRTTTTLCAEDLAFHRSLDPAVAAELDRQNERLLALAERLLRSAAAGSAVVSPRLRDADGLDANWRGVVDVVDSLLERADTSLDEFTGVVKRGQALGSREQSPAPAKLRPAKVTAAGKHFIPKPQILFEHVPTNDETTAFKPLLTTKPHAIIPLSKSLRKNPDDDGLQQYDATFYIPHLKLITQAMNSEIDQHIRYQHPYQKEIESYAYPTSIYTKADPIPYLPFDTTTATFVDTPESLTDMLQELKTAKEIAIDLEHHDKHSYIGLVSLMQISTRDKDWIIDTLKPWRRRLECLNEVFADPNILKVLHGAHMDIIWLQRDLGLYLVGLFDTYHASRVLGYTHGSLKFLLEKFVNFQAQKQHQLADWRTRPLPNDLFEYARADTHFLLYIYDNMRNELIDRSNFSDPEQDRLAVVLERSKEYMLKRYERPFYDAQRGVGPVGWFKQLCTTPGLFTKEQFSVFRAVHQWRDTLARQEDEGTNHVMNNHCLFAVARELPVDKPKLLAIVQPMSQFVRLRTDELLAVIQKAKAAGTNGPEMSSVMAEISSEMPQYAPRAKPQASFGVAQTLALLNKPIVVQGTAPVRSETSSFWGKAFASSVWQQRRSAATDAVSLALPLPALTAEIFMDSADTSGAEAKKPVDAAARAEHAYVKPSERPVEQEDDGIFVVKKLGGSKKRKIAEAAVEEDPDAEISVNQLEAEEKARAKAQRKADKKAAKKLKKQQQNGGASGAANGEDTNGMDVDEPFDYENAPSVLHAPRNVEQEGKAKPFNPYLKSMDAPRGMRRAQKERAGKSKTFSK